MNALPQWLHRGAGGSGDRTSFTRALNTSGAGSVLLQTTIQKLLEFTTNRMLGAVSTLPRKPGTGDKYYVNRRAAATTGAAWVDDSTEPTESEGSYTQASFAYQTLLGRVKITRKLVAQGRSWGDVTAEELVGKTEDLSEVLEQAAFQGTGTSNQISGLSTLLGALANSTQASSQCILNTTTGSEPVNLPMLDFAIHQVKGRTVKADLRMYVSLKGHRILNAALQAQQRFVATDYSLGAGFVVDTYQGIPIVESTGIPDACTFSSSTGQPLAYTGGSSTIYYIANTRYVFWAELTPLTVEPLAKSTSQNAQYDIYTDITLVLSNSKGASLLIGVNE